jgi:hypothetical protein
MAVVITPRFSSHAGNRGRPNKSVRKYDRYWGRYRLEGARFIADVEQWVDTPSVRHGRRSHAYSIFQVHVLTWARERSKECPLRRKSLAIMAGSLSK